MTARISPDPELLRLGAGQLFIDPWDEDGNPTGFRHVGNLSGLEITITPDILIKKSTMTAARPTYKKFVRGIEAVTRAVADEWSLDNLVIIFMGDVTYATAAATPVADQVLFADVPAATLGDALGGRYFHVGALNIGTVSMDVGATALDTDDFTVFNAAYGIVYIKPTAPTTTNGTDDLTVTYTPQAITGKDSPVVRGATRAEVQGSMMFIEDNTAGENHIFRAWSVSMTPDGAIGLISEDPASFAINMTMQDDSVGLHGGSESDPVFHCQLVPALTP